MTHSFGWKLQTSTNSKHVLSFFHDHYHNRHWLLCGNEPITMTQIITTNKVNGSVAGIWNTIMILREVGGWGGEGGGGIVLTSVIKCQNFEGVINLHWNFFQWLWIASFHPLFYSSSLFLSTYLLHTSFLFLSQKERGPWKFWWFWSFKAKPWPI